MKKSLKKLTKKEIKNVKAVKGGNDDKGDGSAIGIKNGSGTSIDYGRR